MIPSIVRTGFTQLRRDRGALLMSFALPIGFFSIFAMIFGGSHNGISRVSVIVVDEDHSSTSQRLLKALLREPELAAVTHPKQKKDGPLPADYDAASAEAAVKQGDASAAVIIPKGFGENPVAFGGGSSQPEFQVLHDSSDPIAGHLVAGLLQKVVMSSMNDIMAQAGMQAFGQASGGLTPQQQRNIDEGLAAMRSRNQAEAESPVSQGSGPDAGGLVRVQERDVAGARKNNPMISFEAAGIGVMFLLFTASAAGGTLLDEKESGALDRVLSSRVTMTTLLAGKMVYCTLLAFAELTLMFLWAWGIFHLDLFGHLSGFIVMGLSTAFAVSSFGMLLASISGTRAQQATDRISLNTPDGKSVTEENRGVAIWRKQDDGS